MFFASKRFNRENMLSKNVVCCKIRSSVLSDAKHKPIPALIRQKLKEADDRVRTMKHN